MQKQEQMQQALRYNNAVRYPILLYQNVFLLLYVVVDLVISSLLFSREEPNNQLTSYHSSLSNRYCKFFRDIQLSL